MKHFINLTNGLEFIDELPDYNFIRIRSTTLERKDYYFLLMDLDHNFLMNLALGEECIVYDCGTRRNLSKTIYKGIPLIKYILERFWLDVDNVPYILSRDGSFKRNSHDYFSKIYADLFIHNRDNNKLKLKRKLNYFRKFLKINEQVNLSGVSISTNNDGNYEYFKNKLWKKK